MSIVHIDDIYYNSNIIVPLNTRIISFSDIHADIHALIIILRDCAGVIRKNHLDINENDEKLEELLNIDLNINELDYRDNLDYIWIGETSQIVIIGDIIDGSRIYANQTFDVRIDKNGKEFENHEYPQIELKILRFINEINRQAILTDGRIYKLLGNHEIVNICTQTTSHFYFENDAEHDDKNDDNDDKYYKGKKRKEIFNYDEYGYNLLFQDGCGALLKINNYIFVHGELIEENYNFYNMINQTINNPLISDNKKHIMENILGGITNKDNTQLWNRTFADPELINLRFSDQNNTFCKNTIMKYFEHFLKDTILLDDINNLKLIIGHCVQSMGNDHYWNTTFINKIHETSQIEILDGIGNSGENDIKSNRIFGITMQCPNITPNNSYKLYHIDVGVSRAFDRMSEINTIIYQATGELVLENENEYF